MAEQVRRAAGQGMREARGERRGRGGEGRGPEGFDCFSFHFLFLENEITV